ncbi:hypothetical protein D3C86_401910 [compost metagenome]
MEAILITLPSSDRLADLMEAIQDAGAPGATVYDSQGMQLLGWLGMHPALARHWGMEGTEHETGKTVLTVVPDHVVEAVVAAADRVLGGFAAPYSGMLCSWKVGTYRCYQGDKPKATQGERL